MMSRPQCARRGKMGHWVRNCGSEPDERGRKRHVGFFSGFQAVPHRSGRCLARRLPAGARDPARSQFLR
eukprot:6317964-Pyramimonas_sp.AAC.1